MGGPKAQIVGYKYLVGAHFLLAHGPLDRIAEIYVDDRLAWVGDGTGGAISINAPELFGGEKREGGIVGGVDIEMGHPSQGPNGYLASMLGSVPAFRGVACAVLKRVEIGLNPYLKPWRFRAQRVFVTDRGAAQWYPEKAGIFTALGGKQIIVGKGDSWELALAANAAAPATANEAGYSAAVPGPFGRDVGPDGLGTTLSASGGYWLRKTIGVAQNGVLRISGRTENSCAIYFDGAKVYDPNPSNSNATGYPSFSADVTAAAGPHTVHIYFRDESPIAIDNAYLSVQVEYVSGDQIDMNPAHILRECITSVAWGKGYPDSDIGSSFTSAADTFFAEGFGLSLAWEDDGPIEDFMQDVQAHVDAHVFVDRRTGKWEIKPIRADYEIDDLLVLGESDVIEVSNPERRDPAEAVNTVTVKYYDRSRAATGATTLRDIALLQEAGQPRPSAPTYRGINHANLAARVCDRELRALSSPVATATIKCTRKADALNPGDPFVLNLPKKGFFNEVMRVFEIREDGGNGHALTLKVASDVFALSDQGLIGEAEVIVDTPTPIAPLARRAVRESTYWELVRDQGHVAVNLALGDDPTIGRLSIAAGNVGGVVFGAQAWTNAGAGFEEVASIGFAPSAELSADVSDDPNETVIAISGGSDLSSVSIGSLASIGGELVRIDAVSPSSITVGRGCLDTVPITHVAGDAVLFFGQFAQVLDEQFVSGEAVETRLLPVTGRGTLALAAAPGDSVTFASRAMRPLPAGNVKANGSFAQPAFAVLDTGNLNLTWAHRDRESQTSPTIDAFTAGNIGPEAGVSYVVELAYEDRVTGAIVEIANSIAVGTATSYSVTPGDFPAPAGNSNSAIVRVRAVRGGLMDRIARGYRVHIPNTPYGYGRAWGREWSKG